MIMFGYDFFGAPNKTFTKKFHSEHKIFNAVELVNFPNGVTSISGKNMRKGMRSATSPNQYLYSGTSGNKKGSGWAQQYENNWLPETNTRMFDQWSNNDGAVMRDDEDSMQYLRPAPNTRMQVEIAFYDCTVGANYNYTGDGGLNIPSQYRRKDGHREYVTVWLNGNNNDYVFIDFDDNLEENSFDIPLMEDEGDPYAVIIKSEEGVWKSHYDPDDDDCSTVFIKPLKVVYTKEGCTDQEATNYDSTAGVDNGSCSFTRATPSLTLDKTEVREGSPVKISWVLDNSGRKGYSKIELYDGSTKIKTSTSRNSYYNYKPNGVGNHPISIKVIWDKGALPNIQSQNLSVVDAVTFIPCGDPNRTTDTNGECDTDCNTGYFLDSTTGRCSQCADPNRSTNSDGCGDCNTGYFLDSTTNFCSQCSDPNRSKNSDGTCGDCLDRYELTAAGICEPVISGGNECADSNRETNSDGSCASSCKSGYSFDSSNMCQQDSSSGGTGVFSSGGGMGMGTIVFFGAIAALSGLAIMQ